MKLGKRYLVFCRDTRVLGVPAYCVVSAGEMYSRIVGYRREAVCATSGRTRGTSFKSCWIPDNGIRIWDWGFCCVSFLLWPDFFLLCIYSSPLNWICIGCHHILEMCNLKKYILTYSLKISHIYIIYFLSHLSPFPTHLTIMSLLTIGHILLTS